MKRSDIDEELNENGSVNWELLDTVTDPSRARIIHTILGHPKELASVREIDYMNPEMKKSNIDYHLRELVDNGIAEKVSLPKGKRKRDLPSTFYGITERGEELLKKHNLWNEKEMWELLYQSVEKNPEIQRIEDMERPDST
ncbi:MAG: transcriptional regulator [Halobacteria archaeon]|nr:transcriptional regulator [Halobacteria archaeon]